MNFQFKISNYMPYLVLLFISVLGGMLPYGIDLIAFLGGFIIFETLESEFIFNIIFAVIVQFGIYLYGSKKGILSLKGDKRKITILHMLVSSIIYVFSLVFMIATNFSIIMRMM